MCTFLRTQPNTSNRTHLNLFIHFFPSYCNCSFSSHLPIFLCCKQVAACLSLSWCRFFSCIFLLKEAKMISKKKNIYILTSTTLNLVFSPQKLSVFRRIRICCQSERSATKLVCRCEINMYFLCVSVENYLEASATKPGPLGWQSWKEDTWIESSDR